MNRTNNLLHVQSVVAVALALGASTALADDSSMSVLTGDSYAYFNQLDFTPGRFNTARATMVNPGRDTAMKRPEKTPAIVEKPTLLAEHPRISPTNPFSDNKGA